MKRYDAVIVGARCAGSALAIELAAGGMDGRAVASAQDQAAAGRDGDHVRLLARIAAHPVRAFPRRVGRGVDLGAVRGRRPRSHPQRQARADQGIGRSTGARLPRRDPPLPETLAHGWLDQAERISALRIAPETMLRGYFRRPTGPGWALIGDAGHFKHPSTAQGIGDALEQAHHVAKGLLGADPDLSGYERWRDRRAEEHHEWSFDFGRLPRREFAELLYAGLAHDERAAQDFRDVFTPRVDPRSELLTPERRARWFTAAA